jgi:transcriptional regulator NrdR family protein
MKHLVKRGGHVEEYDARKLYASIYAACLAASTSVLEAEVISDQVVKLVEKKIGTREEINSNEIFKLAIHELKDYHTDAGYLYESHRDIS